MYRLPEHNILHLLPNLLHRNICMIIHYVSRILLCISCRVQKSIRRGHLHFFELPILEFGLVLAFRPSRSTVPVAQIIVFSSLKILPKAKAEVNSIGHLSLSQKTRTSFQLINIRSLRTGGASDLSPIHCVWAYPWLISHWFFLMECLLWTPLLDVNIFRCKHVIL